jgi:hypothetical protein
MTNRKRENLIAWLPWVLLAVFVVAAFVIFMIPAAIEIGGRL